LSQELKKSEDDNFIEELEEFSRSWTITKSIEEESYKHLDFDHEDHEDEDCAISFLRCNGNPSTVFPCDPGHLITPRGFKEILLEKSKSHLSSVLVGKISYLVSDTSLTGYRLAS